MRRLPDVIGIGSRRCGSSWVHRCLSAHPEIGKPANGVHFFSEHREKGVDWYVDQLRPFAHRRRLMEFSVSYSYPDGLDETARFMASLVPGARLFLLVRDPVMRAVSDYRRGVNRLEIDKDTPFERAIEEQPVLLERGRYARILDVYLAHFRREQIRVFFFDDLARDQQAFARELFTWLDVDASLALDEMEQPGETMRSVRWPWYQHAVLRAKDGARAVAARTIGLERWDRICAAGMPLYHRLLRVNEMDYDVSPATRKALTGYFKDEITRLSALTGRDLSAWS